MPKHDRPLLGSRLKEAATSAGYNSETIAELLGVGASTVRGWWIGRTEPSLEVLRTYSRLVGRSIDYLAGGRDFAEVVADFVERVMSGTSPGQAVEALEIGRLTPGERRLLDQWGEEIRSFIREHAPAPWASLSPSARRRFVAALLEEPPP